MLCKLLALPWTDRILLIEAALFLGIARLALVMLPFRQIAPFLGQLQATPPLSHPVDVITLRRLHWAIAVAAKYVPWSAVCLPQAMAGKIMLRHRGIPSTLYLGVFRDGHDGLTAHAWLGVGDMIVTGEHGRERFTVVSTFS